MVEAELRNLLNLVTVTETCFFRDASQFRLLREHIIPALIAERSARATELGQDPHLERRLLERRRGVLDRDHARRRWACSRRVPDWTIEIIGTDLNTKALEKASAGCVRRARCAQRRRAAARRLLRARREDVCAELRRSRTRVKFEFGNLTQTPMPSTGPQDIVFCKNVAIYFRADVTRKLIEGPLRHARRRWLSAAGPCRIVVAVVGRLHARRARAGILLPEECACSQKPAASSTRRSSARWSAGDRPVRRSGRGRL